MAKKKKASASGKTGARREGTGPAREAMASLIREKEAAVTDGALQVIIALASVTTLVTVDTTQDPPAFEPENLGTLTFNDSQVGLADEDMAIFKANLKTLLPQIGDDIDQIPDNASLNIGDVAKFIQLSLMAA
jgi:hypothetical protein